MASQIRSKMSVILPLIKTLLMDALDLPTERVIITQSNTKPNFQADRVVFLRVRRMTSQVDAELGGGNYENRVVRFLDVIPSVRMDTDSTSDEPWLLDEDLGFFAFEEAILTALCGHFLVDEQGNHVLDGSTIKLISETDAQKIPGAPGWGESLMTFRLSYELDVDLTK